MFRKFLASCSVLALAMGAVLTIAPPLVSAGGFASSEGWQKVWLGPSESDPGGIVQQTDGSVVFTDPDGAGEQFLVLNADNVHSSDANRADFGHTAMARFTADYEVKATNIGSKVSFCINGNNSAHLGDGAIQVLWHPTQRVALWKEGVTGSTSPYGQFAGTGLYDLPTGDSWHRFHIIKDGATVSVSVDGVSVFDRVDLNSDGAGAFAGSGYIGFHVAGAIGALRNVRITNDTTGVTRTFFESVEDDGVATTYYVSSTTGSDANDGLTPATAFASANAVNALQLGVGDTILFKRGDTFPGMCLKPRGTGVKADGQWITLDAYGEGDAPRLDGSGVNDAAISLSYTRTKGGYKIRNLDISGYPLGLVSNKSGMADAFDGLLIENCAFRDITTGRGWEPSPNLPEGAPLSYGMMLRYVNDVQIINCLTDNCDSPGRVQGKNVTFSAFTAANSGVQGLMLYGTAYGSAVLEANDNFLVQGSRFLGTGRMGFQLGTTGIMMENLNGCTVKDTEIANTVNAARAYDACALDWENNNVNCVIDNVYAHDNDGPFLLAMEHAAEPASLGVARGNRIRDSLSVNNGRRSVAAEGSFINLICYSNANQTITVQNCVDIGMPGSVPCTTENPGVKTLQTTLPASRFNVDGFVSATADVYESFNEAGLSAFSSVTGASITNSHLSLSEGTAVRTSYTGAGYVASSYLKGNAGFLFLSPDADNGYLWRAFEGRIEACKKVNGSVVKIKDIAAPELHPSHWFRIRVETGGGVIRTYLDEQLLDTLSDSTFTAGAAGYLADGAAEADELFVYTLADKARQVTSFDVTAGTPSGGKLTFTGDAFHTDVTNWTTGAGIGFCQYSPQGVGYTKITGDDAYLERQSMSVNVSPLFSKYNKLSILLSNATTSGYVTIEYKKSGTWYGKDIQIAAMSDDGYPFDRQETTWKRYTVDMTGASGWSGTITGLRIRFHATSGYVNIADVTISK